MRKIRISESKLIKVIEKILKEQHSDRREELKKILLDSFNFEDYDIETTNPFAEGWKLFLDENGHDIPRYGIRKAFINYLMGLPSWINLPYYDDDIKDLMYAIGYDEVKDDDMDESQIQKLFYKEIYDIFVENK